MRKVAFAATLLMVSLAFSFYMNYVVQRGDTLYEISKNSKIPISVLIDWNPGLTPSTLKVGSTIKVPLVPGIMYKPTREISLTSLARYFFIDVSEIKAVNPNIPSTLKPGKEYFVPLGRVNTAFTETATFIWPIYGTLTSEYGWRIHPIYGQRHFHIGIDLAAPEGTPVFAARAGTVTYAGWRSAYGYLIVIDHGDYETYYGHLSRVNVFVGQRVEKGDFIARSGNTGTSTGPHLHFEIRRNGETYDPIAYLPRTNVYVMRRVLTD